MEDNLITKVRKSVDIVDIIGERIPLVARGKNYFGVCPFHDDTNPSMSVSREKQIYTCFSCHASGNVFNFIMDYDHVDFKTALKFLADKAGIDAGNIKLTKKVQKNDHLYEAYRLANIYYQNNLKSVAGKKALDYLKERKIDNSLIKKFGIGLSLNKKDDLTKLLLKKKYDLDDLNRIGLSNVDYDMYQDRIMFPLEDIEGNIVGFSGRIYRDSDESKYINTKESSIFKKGLTIYNYQRALEEVRKSKQVIIMEGFMDVIRASSIGVNNAVALMGTAMTNDQLDIIRRMSNNIVLCLDGDSAGKKAALAIGEHFQKKGIEVKVVTIPSDLDPDEFIIKNGEAKFKELVSKAINYSDYKIAALKENINFDSDLELSKYIDQVIKEAVRIDDDIRVELILKNLAKTYNLSYNTLEKRFRDYEKTEKKEQVTIKKPQEIKKITKYDKALYSIIYYMLRDDKVIESMKEKKIIYPNETAKILVNEIIYYYEKYGELEIADFYTYLDGKEELIVLLNEILQLNLPDKIKEEDLAEYIKVVKDYSKNQAIKRLKEKLEKEEDPLEQAKIAEEIKKIKLGE
ncbi:MAG: DNA primase [Bacilli bacterium]|nr:DNA primase [Bacilli bacterium]